MKEAYIQAISYYLPDRILDNENLTDLFPEWSPDKISAKTGIFERRISATDEFTSTMAVRASEALFKEHAIDRNKIDFILLCTQSPDYFLPTTACIVQRELGISNSVGALDFNLGCSGYIYGLSLAKGLICANVASNILLITSETYSKFINKNDKSNKTIFGDGASASLISAENGFCEIGDFELGTDGKGAENLIVRNGGSKHQIKNGVDIFDGDEFVYNDDNLYMNGSEIFNFTAKSVPLMIENLLSKVNQELSSIDLFIFHQANQFMLNFIRKKIGIPEDKFFIFLKNCGNTVSSTIPIALYEALKSGRIKAKDKVVLAGFGVGYSWGSTILKFK